jgi:restriction system protein
MTEASCPSCYTTQEILAGAPGFKCIRCGTESVTIVCARCGVATLFYGSTPQGNQILSFRCAACSKKNYLSPAAIRAAKEQVRVATRIQKADEKARKEQERQDQRARMETTARDVDEQNAQLLAYVNRLQNLLAETLEVDDYIDFETFKETVTPPPFEPRELGRPLDPPEPRLPPKPSPVGRLLPGAKSKHEEEVRAAGEKHQAAMVDYEARERARKERLGELKAQHEAEVSRLAEESARQHAAIEDLKSKFGTDDPAAVVYYFSRVLEASHYPQTFPRHTKIAFSPESKQLVVEFALPGFEVIPAIKSYKHVKTRDEISEAPRPLTHRKSLYASVIAQIAVRTLHEIFEADRDEKVDTVVFNGYVDTVDAATGQAIQPHLVTVRTTRDSFEAIDLSKVQAEACLKGLNAGVSRSPSELAPVRPVVDFNMVDPRFVQETDVLSELDARPNLMELTPTEFESLITNLFERMGLETRATRPSRDGGVDCVAWDNRPIFGGKVIIQAKRYKNTVGVAAVRDLFGTLHNEGANKGILVTTSGYGKAAFDFAQAKPIELLDGGNLLYLLKDHAGIDAKIEPPEDWVDPAPEMTESP